MANYNDSNLNTLIERICPSCKYTHAIIADDYQNASYFIVCVNCHYDHKKPMEIEPCNFISAMETVIHGKNG